MSTSGQTLKYERDVFAWALAELLDGVKEHEIVNMLGCSDAYAKQIYEIGKKAAEFKIRYIENVGFVS